jgi:hypothetical protein
MKSIPTLLVCSIVFSLAAGCATSTGTSEERREVVLKYVGHDVGTSGPFSKKGIRELDVLDDNERKQATALLQGGAQGFLIMEPNPALPNRIILISGDRVVGDFRAKKKE